jgi:hypothetical protein
VTEGDLTLTETAALTFADRMGTCSPSFRPSFRTLRCRFIGLRIVEEAHSGQADRHFTRVVFAKGGGLGTHGDRRDLNYKVFVSQLIAHRPPLLQLKQRRAYHAGA